MNQLSETSEIAICIMLWGKNTTSNPWPLEHRAGALSTELPEPMQSNVIQLNSIYDRHPVFFHKTTYDPS